MAMTRGRSWPIHLFGVVIDERFHAHSAHVEHVASDAGGARSLGRAPDTALATHAWDGGHGWEMELGGDGSTMRGGDGALAGEAAEGMEG